jgi:xanthine dehydrogenase YagT iron-sulfur-binding subunit
MSDSDSLTRAGAARRRFLLETTALTGSLAAPAALAAGPAAAAPPDARDRATVPQHRVPFNVNGRDYDLTLDPRVTLLDVLREHLDLTGTKKGCDRGHCDRGQCGACTVLVDGRRVNSCLTLAVALDGARVVTVEGLARGGALHAVQEAFVTLTASSAATAHRDRSAPPWPCSTRPRPGP